MTIQVYPYRGYDIVFNAYNRGEYTVQYEGDDIIFTTPTEAKEFIDGIA